MQFLIKALNDSARVSKSLHVPGSHIESLLSFLPSYEIRDPMAHPAALLVAALTLLPGCDGSCPLSRTSPLMGREPGTARAVLAKVTFKFWLCLGAEEQNPRLPCADSRSCTSSDFKTLLLSFSSVPHFPTCSNSDLFLSGWSSKLAVNWR